MTFRKINDNLIEVMNEQGNRLILSREEAKQLGYVEFTYQGKPITIVGFAKLIDKNEDAVQQAVRKHKFTTGEQIIAYYAELEQSKKLTYQGKPITAHDFAKLIGKSKNAVQAAVQNHKFTTGEQIIAYYAELEQSKKLTYQGKSITLTDFAKLIGKSNGAIQRTAYTYKFVTGEQIIAYYAELEQSKKLTYQGKPITLIDFAKLIGKNEKAVKSAVRKHKFTTGEQIIDYYTELDQSKKLTYQGKSITIHDFAELIDKNESTVQSAVRKHKFTTGEQVIAHYDKLDASKLTYQGKLITIRDFAKLIGKNESTVEGTARRRGLITGEQIIAYYQSIGKL